MVQFPARLSTPHEWRPLTAEEVAVVAPLLEECSRLGRPMHDPLARFEACLRAACSGQPWLEQEIAHQKADTLHRAFRRWAARGLWLALLERVARLRGRLPALEYFICRAVRRAARIQGLRGIVAVRRLGMLSALRAPPHRLPDPDLSERYHAEHILPGLGVLHRMGRRQGMLAARLWRRMVAACKGAARIRREWEPA